MINIISRAYLSKRASGPKKVVDNLIKGLDLIGYPYIINKRLDACRRLWIHDDASALAGIAGLRPDIKVIAGPNIYVLPRNIPDFIDLSGVVYLHPSQWVKDFWDDFGFNRCAIEVWPAGIDTGEFKPSDKEKKYVLIYFKQRDEKELETVENILKRLGICYKIINYGDVGGQYKESEYKNLLAEAKYMIWIGRQESQGIALEEAMSANVPVLVCDVSYVGQWRAAKKFMAVLNEKENAYQNTTSAPYFDERCGLKIKNLSDIVEAINKMESGWRNFKPRQYILENLNLEKQARDFAAIYEKYFNLGFDAGLNEKPINRGNWRNNKFYYKTYFKFRESARPIIRMISR